METGIHQQGVEKDISATENTSMLRTSVFSAGAAMFGVAGLNPGDSRFGGYPRAVSIGAVLSRGVLDTIVDGPTKVYAYHYRTINAFLDQIAARAVSYIESSGYRSFHVPASQIIDWDDLTGSISHKEIARLGGLGFIGRNNLLVNPLYGAAVRLVSVLTDMPLTENVPVDMDCGDCRACISVCPVGAIGEKVEDFNLEKCKEKLKWFKKHLVGHHICGVCVKACKGLGNA
jgi:epoxyqueuosine reductase